MSWPFAQIVAVCLIFLAIDEWLTRRRWWLLGFLLALTAAARISAGLNIALFTGAALFCEKKGRAKIVAALAVGFTIPIFFLAAYNFIRFGSMFRNRIQLSATIAPGTSPPFRSTNVIPICSSFYSAHLRHWTNFPFFAANTYGMSCAAPFAVAFFSRFAKDGSL